MAAYHPPVAEEPVGTQLVDEAADMTANELHVRVVHRLHAALSHALAGRAAVFCEIFLRVDNREQVAADVFVVPGLTAGIRTVYAVPTEPVPAVTVEVLSPANKSGRGRRELEAKRSLFARIGVPLHIEIDPEDGFVAVWELRGGSLVRTDMCITYSSEAIGGVRLETPEPGILDVLLPDGHNVLSGGDELARAEREAARAGTEAARAEREAARAGRESARAEQEAARADRLAARLRELGVDPEA